MSLTIAKKIGLIKNGFTDSTKGLISHLHHLPTGTNRSSTGI
jgi:hypothetical protein